MIRVGNDESYVFVDSGACAAGCDPVFFPVWLKTFFQKREAVVFAKHHDGDGMPCAWQPVSPVSDTHDRNGA